MKKEFNQVEDFLEDNSFREWVLNERNQRNLFWESWSGKYPEKAAVFLEAKEILLALGDRVLEWDDKSQERALASIDRKIDAKNQRTPKGRGHNRYGRWMNWAAILLVLMTGATMAMWSLQLLPADGDGTLASVEDQWVHKFAGPAS